MRYWGLPIGVIVLAFVLVARFVGAEAEILRLLGVGVLMLLTLISCQIGRVMAALDRLPKRKREGVADADNAYGR